MLSTNSSVPALAVGVSDHASPFADSAQSFSQSHQLELFIGPLLDQAKYVLYFDENGPKLYQTGKGAPGPISASFLSGKNAHRMRHGGGKGQLVAKAVGLNKGVYPHVLDATAGLGRDAFVLATLGCKVDMYERVPVVEFLLQHALEEAQSFNDMEIAKIAQRMTLQYGDAITKLESSSEPVADVIYLDPMYPAQEKSAAVKKEMRAFHDLVGENLDDHRLLSAALDNARYRVVVKRPRKGKEIAGQKPSLKLEGKSSRYDIYTIKSLSEL
ncbi:MAG: class I SAM-dependent methyltransferase [Oleiphilaceae bacterium]|nr:class I SAM-dependent methyltransferase [Oleiphilaceae bacterium]